MARDLGGIYTAIEADVEGLKKAVRATKKLAAIADKQFKKVSGTARKEFDKTGKAAAMAARVAEKASKDSARVAIAKSRDSTKIVIESMRATERAAKDTAKAKIAATRRAEKAATKAAKATARDYKEASKIAIASTKAQVRGQIAASKATAAAAKKAARVSAQAAKKAERAHKRWQITMLGVGVAAAIVAKKILKMADTYNVLQQRIKAATLATGDYSRVSEELSAIAHRTGTELLGNVALFQTLARTAPELDSTNNQMLKLTETLGQLGVIGGSSTMQMRNGLLQFSQAMAGGIFRAEEMNGIIENIPEVAARIATGMDMTVGALRLATLEGKVLSKDVFDALMKQSKEISKQFGDMPEVISRSFVKVVNSTERFLGRLDKAKGLTTGIANIMTGFATTLNSLNANAFANGLERVSFYLAAIAIVKLGAVIAGLWKLKAALLVVDKGITKNKLAALVILLAEVGYWVKNSEPLGDFVDTKQLDLAKKDLEDLEKIKERGRRKGPAGAGFEHLYGDGKLDTLIDKARANVRAYTKEIADAKRAVLDLAIQAHIDEGYESGVAFDESHGQRFRGNNVANTKKYEKKMQDIADNAAADKLAKQKQAAQQWIGSFNKGLMTERELIKQKYKDDLANLNTAERTKIETLLPYSELRVRLQRQEWEALKALKEKENKWWVDGLADITLSLMTEEGRRKKARKKALKDKEAVLTKAFDEGRISEKQRGYQLGKIKDQFAKEDIDRAKQTAAEVAEAANAAWEATGVPALRERYASEKTIAHNAHFERLEGLKAALALEADFQAEHDERKKQSAMELADDLAAIDEGRFKGLSTLRQVFGKENSKWAEVAATKEGEINEKAFFKAISLAEGHSRELFNIQKGLAVAQALIDAPASILSSFKFGSSLGGPPLGYAFAALAAAATATHVAAIQSASYGGGRLYGGSVAPNTAYNVNEDGRPELLTVGGKDMLMMGSQGGKVTPNNKLVGSTDVNIKVNITNTQGQEARVTDRRKTSDGYEIDVFMEAVDKFTAAGIRDGNSETVDAIGKRFGGNSAYGNF